MTTVTTTTKRAYLVWVLDEYDALWEARGDAFL
jgi:hypothetical protein